MGSIDDIVFEYFQEPIVLRKKDVEAINNIGLYLYYHHRLLKRRSDMDGQLQRAIEYYGTRRTNLTRVEAVRFLFYSFATDSMCQLVLFDPVSKSYRKPVIDDTYDPNFRLDQDYMLKIESEGRKTYILDVKIYINGVHSITIYVNSMILKKGGASVNIEQDPRDVPDSKMNEYLRKFWSTLDSVFYTRVFSRLRSDMSILASRSASTSTSV